MTRERKRERENAAKGLPQMSGTKVQRPRSQPYVALTPGVLVDSHRRFTAANVSGAPRAWHLAVVDRTVPIKIGTPVIGSGVPTITLVQLAKYGQQKNGWDERQREHRSELWEGQLQRFYKHPCDTRRATDGKDAVDTISRQQHNNNRNRNTRRGSPIPLLRVRRRRLEHSVRRNPVVKAAHCGGRDRHVVDETSPVRS